ncbi:hypothetical protein HZB01_03080 [Candidatus Woesearchaeota archaeon]|nr:hypothetical protein [Candidatus Woesearchaeota archaeon]
MTNPTYEKLQKKHNLPSFEEMDMAFGIAIIEEKELTLQSIRKRMMEKLEFFTDVLRPLLQPDANFWEMTESSSFNDDEKKQMFQLYMKMMFLARTALEVELEDTEANEALFIKKFATEWQPLKKELLMIVKKLKSSWANDIQYKSMQDYLG